MRPTIQRIRRTAGGATMENNPKRETLYRSVVLTPYIRQAAASVGD